MAGSSVCGVDDYPAAANTARFAVGLGEQLGLRVVLVYVANTAFVIAVPTSLAPPATHAPGEASYWARAASAAEARLDQLASQEGLWGAELRAETGDPAERILAVAADERAELIVVGSRRRGVLSSLFLASASSAIVSRAECPVVIVPEEVVVSPAVEPTDAR